MKICIGVVGKIGSGKDFVSDYLVKKYSFSKFHMGDTLRELAKKEGLEITRENLQDLQDKYHKEQGHNFLIDMVMNKIKESQKEYVVLTGIRTPEQSEKFKEEPNTNLIYVKVKPEIRFNRLKSRKRKGFPETQEKFLEKEKREEQFFDFDKIMDYIDNTIENNTTAQDLYNQIDDLVDKLKG